jgi:AcrR family transcriptional regulator
MSIDLASRTPTAGSARSLILTAERLIATHGFWGASLRQITEAAGVRNASAVQYHFGSREGLLAAVYEHRFRQVDARRLEALTALERAGRQNDLRAVLDAMVKGLSEELKARPEGNYFIRFLERRNREFGDVPADDGRYSEGAAWSKADTHLCTAMAYLPEEIIWVRLLTARDHMLFGLASIEAALDREPALRSRIDLWIETLVDGLCAVLLAPISQQAMSKLQPR